MGIKLTGAYLEIYKVVTGTPDTLTKVAETRDDVSIDMNVETRETKEHMNPIVYKLPTHYAPVMSFAGLLTSTIAAWETLGFMAAGAGAQTVKPYVTLDAVVVKVYEKETDVTPKHTIKANDVVVNLTNFSYPNEDFAAWEGEVLSRGVVSLDNGA